MGEQVLRLHNHLTTRQTTLGLNGRMSSCEPANTFLAESYKNMQIKKLGTVSSANADAQRNRQLCTGPATLNESAHSRVHEAGQNTLVRPV